MFVLVALILVIPVSFTDSRSSHEDRQECFPVIGFFVDVVVCLFLFIFFLVYFFYFLMFVCLFSFFFFFSYIYIELFFKAINNS